jgi:hypothetical protein
MSPGEKRYPIDENKKNQAGLKDRPDNKEEYEMMDD